MRKKKSGIDFDLIEKTMQENPQDWFKPAEAERRMKETMGRLFGKPRTMNLKTGQNLQPPFLSEAELKVRGYPCEWDCE